MGGAFLACAFLGLYRIEAVNYAFFILNSIALAVHVEKLRKDVTFIVD
jgi:hypothetical protein